MLLLRLLQAGQQGGEAVEATMDGLWLSAVDRRQHSQQHVVACRKTQAETGGCFYDSWRNQEDSRFSFRSPEPDQLLPLSRNIVDVRQPGLWARYTNHPENRRGHVATRSG